MRTFQLLKETGIRPTRLRYLLLAGKVPRPPKDPTGEFEWPPNAVAQVRAAIAVDRRRRHPVSA